jgi:hypothetical protein
MAKPSQDDIFRACLITKKIAENIDYVRQDLLDSEDFINGPPGMGKTHLIIEGLNRVNKQIGRDYLIARSHITPRMFYAMLYLMRNEDQYVVLDDCDGVMSNEEGLNLLKAATDPTFRKIGWVSSSDVKLPDGTVIPNEFEFNGSVIIATNIRNSAKGRAAQHFAAIKSRCVSWAMNYDSLTEQFAYIYHLVVDKNYLDANAETQLTWAQKIDLIKFIMSNLSQCHQLDLRKPQHIARWIKNKQTNWQNQARRFLTAE